MTDATTLLFDLDDFDVVDVTVDPDVPGGRVVVVTAAVEPACPGLRGAGGPGALPAAAAARGPAGRVGPAGRALGQEAPVLRRDRLPEADVQRGHRPGRAAVAPDPAAAGEAGGRGVPFGAVRGGHRPQVRGVVVVGQRRPRGPGRGADPRPAPGGAPARGDETRPRSVRYYLAAGVWKRTDPWMTSFVDLDPSHPRALLGLAPGRSGAAVTGWLAAQTPEFRAGIEVVAVDPSAPFAAALRRSLPHAELVVDVFHLHQLANTAVADTRRRVTQQRFGHRGRTGVDAWSYRRLLLRDGRALSTRQWTRLRVAVRHRRPQRGAPRRAGREGAAAPAPGRRRARRPPV